MRSIRILIADDQTLMRDGLKIIFDLEEDMEVVGTADNGQEAYEMTGLLKPDVVLMDIRMPGMDGVESTRLIKRDYPGTIVVILTTFDDEEYVIQALCFGANGYLLKDMQGDKLIESIRDAASGNMMLPARIAARLASRLASMSAEARGIHLPDSNGFSEREKDIIRLMVKGFSNKQIATALCVTEGTAKNYISAIYNKIGTSDRTKAVLHLKNLVREE